jgi:hypothetical protein
VAPISKVGGKTTASVLKRFVVRYFHGLILSEYFGEGQLEEKQKTCQHAEPNKYFNPTKYVERSFQSIHNPGREQASRRQPDQINYKDHGERINRTAEQKH